MNFEVNTQSRTRRVTEAVFDEITDRVVAAPEATLDTVITVTRWIKEAFAVLADEKVREQDFLTFADAMRFFPANRARVPWAKAGAVLRTANGPRQLIRLLYLDGNYRPLAGGAPMAAYSVLDVDDELRAAFGAHDLIIVT